MAQLNDTVITGSLSVTDKINGPIADAGNGTGTTFAYSKAGVTNPDWLAAWNGYELRAVLRSNLTVGSANTANDLASGTVLSVAKGGTGQTTQANVNKAIIGALTEGTSDVTDETMFVSSYASNNGFADTNDGGPNKPYKRTFLHVWNYIKSKISGSIGGFTESEPEEGNDNPISCGGVYENVTKMSDFSVISSLPNSISNTSNNAMCYFKDKLYFADYSTGVYASSDGINFSLVLSTFRVKTLFSYNGKLYVGAEVLYVSTDGLTFTSNANIQNISYIYAYADKIIVAAIDSTSVIRTYISIDDGVTFTQMQGTFFDTNSMIAFQTTIQVCSTTGLYQNNITNINDFNWYQLNNDLTSKSVTCACEYNSTIYYGTDEAGLFYITRTLNSINNYTEVSTDFSAKKINDLCVCNGYLYVATNSGLYYSSDGVNFTEDSNFNFLNNISVLYNFGG